MTIAEERLQDRVAALIGAQESDGRADLLRAFADAYLRRHSRGDADPQATLNEIRGAFELVADRGRRPAVVRAFTPSDYECAGSVVEATTDDLPYLVDSLQAALQSGDGGVRRVVHPMLGTERDREGGLLAITPPRDSARRESFMHFELDHRLEDDELRELEERLLGVLADVRRVVADYPAMSQRVGFMVERARRGAGEYPFDEVNEAIAFLRWLLEDNFTFLGYREYDASGGVLRVSPGSGLGLLADEQSSHLASGREIAKLRPSVQARIDHGDLLVVTKTNAFSPVRRRTRMDYVGVRFEGEDGHVGECRLIGLFTTKAYAAPAADTPLLHHKLRRILDAEDLIDGSHDHRNAVAIFGSFPKDELFAAGWQDLRAMVVALLAMQADEVRVLGRRSHDDRTAAVVVAMPRRRYSAALVDRVEKLLRGHYEDATLESHVVVDDQFTHARAPLHDPLAVGPSCRRPTWSAWRREVTRLARPWDQAVEAVLRRRCGRSRAAELAATWCPRFPDFYKAATEPDLAAADIERLDELEAGDDELVVGLQHAEGRSGPRTRLALYKRGGKVRAVGDPADARDARPARATTSARRACSAATRTTFVQNFGVLGPDGVPLELEAARRPAGRSRSSPSAAGGTDSDWLSRLVLVAGLTWQQVGMLRAYRVYRQRAGARFGLKYDGEAFAVAAAHRPSSSCATSSCATGRGRRRPAPPTRCATQILADLDAVESLDQDRILRDQLTLVDATLRTNAFRAGARRDGDQAALGRRTRACRRRGRSSRSSCTPWRWRASTCAAARSPAAACAGRTGWTSAPRSTG